LEYLERSKEQYEIAMKYFVYNDYSSWKNFFRFDLLWKAIKLNIFGSLSSYVERYFKSEYIQKLMQYHLLFLGTSPYDAPAVYNIMAHVDFDM
jgi:phytoene desaturase